MDFKEAFMFDEEDRALAAIEKEEIKVSVRRKGWQIAKDVVLG